ncbi:MAG: RNA polymerase sigma factor [Bacteroidota bacterium]
MKESNLPYLIQACRENKPQAQQQLFRLMYNFGMSVAARYGRNLQETEEIANDGFLKMLRNIDRYRPEVPFKLWLRRIIINCGIDHYRKRQAEQRGIYDLRPPITHNQVSENLEGEYLLRLVQHLPAQYRIVFVLHVIEGYSHNEIANSLGISRGTSKSNLAKARKKLQQMLQIHHQQISGYGK